MERSHHLLPSHGGCRRWHTSLGYLDARLERWRAACIDFVLDIFRLVTGFAVVGFGSQRKPPSFPRWTED